MMVMMIMRVIWVMIVIVFDANVSRYLLNYHQHCHTRHDFGDDHDGDLDDADCFD